MPRTGRRECRHPQLERQGSARKVLPLDGRRARAAIRPTKSSSSITAPPTAAPSSSAAHFPKSDVWLSPKNLGFGGGSNAGFRAAKNDIVVLLNSDMRVAPDFLPPLLEGFTDETSSPSPARSSSATPPSCAKKPALRKAGGRMARLRVRHRDRPAVTGLFPCFYGGGGSCAFDRRKVPRAGRLRRLLAPFYLEDTDLGYMAWKRGWKVLYQPAQRGLSRASRHHRQALQPRPYSSRPQEELLAVLLEKHPRMATLGCALLLHLWPARSSA